MESYAKPIVRAITENAGSCGCNFRFNDTTANCSVTGIPPVQGGACVTANVGRFEPAEPDAKPILTNTILGVSDGGVAVTPLANTGIPGTQPITFGVPVGTRGIYLDVTLQGATLAHAQEVGVNVLGVTAAIVLP